MLTPMSRVLQSAERYANFFIQRDATFTMISNSTCLSLENYTGDRSSHSISSSEALQGNISSSCGIYYQTTQLVSFYLFLLDFKKGSMEQS